MKTDEPFPILGFALGAQNALPLDLSTEHLNTLEIDPSDNAALSQYIYNGKIRYGGYAERRNIYRRSSSFSSEDIVREIHLGLDIWASQGQVLYAPWQGQVISAHDNKGHGDYGPTLIIRHQLKDKDVFVLYGHLDRNSVDRWAANDLVNKGQAFAALGDEQVNGGWPPHVHIQFIYDLEGQISDYPGVCSSKDWGHYRSNCPDPTPYFIS